MEGSCKGCFGKEIGIVDSSSSQKLIGQLAIVRKLQFWLEIVFD